MGEECSVGYLPGVETTEVEVHLATYSLLQIIEGRLSIGSTNQVSITTVVEVASGKGHA